jgi:restriction endonuclease S subunit
MTEVLSEEPLLFSVEFGVLDDRFDPIYYQPEYLEIKEILGRLPNVQTLEEISTRCKKGIFYILASEYREEGIPFIRVSNVKDQTIDHGDLVYISEEKNMEENRTCFSSGDIVITKTGNIRVSMIPKDISLCNISQDIIGVAIKDAYNPVYISVFLSSRFGLLQMEQISQGQVQFHLTVSDVRNIKIPIPSRPVQDKIANIMQNAYGDRKKYLQRADELLNSIDDLILDELGIEIPEVKAKWYYSVKKGDIEDRLDAEFYKLDYVTLIEALKRSKYEFSNLKVISKLITRGTEVGSGEYKEDGFPFLRVQNIQKYEINFDDCVFISEETYNNLKRYKIETNDVLFTKDGTIGLSTLVPEGIQDCITSSGISRIKLNENVNPNYVVAVLNTDFIRLQAERISYGSIIIHFSLTELEKLKIPLPPLKIQNKIANEVKNRREEIENLRIRAETVIGEAKKRVERMILGKNGGAT